MKIVTVNVEESYLKAIEKLIGDDGLYPSRSELIRCAVRDFLLNELKNHRKSKENHGKINEDFDDKNYVRVPVENREKGTKELKTYKIVKTLDAIQGTKQDSGYATKSNDRNSIRKKGRSEKRHKNPFWSKRDGYYQSKEDEDLVFIKGKGKMSKDKAIKSNLIEV
jgi:Arc/MetJ-type ribon-helix-helix transcriptional regulator